MIQSWKSFIAGALAMLIVVVIAYMLFLGMEKRATIPENSVADTEDFANKVTIIPLPSLRIIRGTEVAFEGKKELRQAIGGRAAQDISIVNFQATGEHADKSVITIVWENGEVEKVYPGTKNKKFSPEKRAVEILVIGYSMHERSIFRDASRKGTLTWEIRYEPVN